MDDFSTTELRKVPDLWEFFHNPEVLLVKSLSAKAWQQVEPRLRKQPGTPLTSAELRAESEKYFTRVLVRERMLILFPFHHILFKLLEQDPFLLTSKELRKIVKESKMKIKSNRRDRDSLRLLASAYAFLDAMTESEDALRKALANDRRFSDAWYMIGALLYGFDRFQDADKALAQAVLLDPSNKLLKKYHLRIHTKVLAEMIRAGQIATDEGGIPLE